jgi:chemotaxis methyl-accepting protein methylase
MVAGHITVKKKAMACIAEFAQGNFEAPLEKFPGKKAFINDNIERLRVNLQSLISDANTLVKAALSGSLSTRADATKHNGDYRKIVEGVNHTAMTNNEIWFFRDFAPFETLRQRVIPEMIVTRRLSRRLNIWSAACSSGQEAYSTLILLHEHFPETASWDVRVLGTDYSQAMIERVKAGRHSQFEVNRGLPIGAFAKHFVQRGLEWEISPRFRNLVDCTALEPG